MGTNVDAATSVTEERIQAVKERNQAYRDLLLDPRGFGSGGLQRLLILLILTMMVPQS